MQEKLKSVIILINTGRLQTVLDSFIPTLSNY